MIHSFNPTNMKLITYLNYTKNTTEYEKRNTYVRETYMK